MLKASCHCGAVRLEIDRKPKTLTECNCSICRRYGARWAYFTHKSARVSSVPGATACYSWNDRELEFYHCTACGCVTHYENKDKSPDGRFAVNARMMSPEDVEDVRIRRFDGADTWKYVD